MKSLEQVKDFWDYRADQFARKYARGDWDKNPELIAMRKILSNHGALIKENLVLDVGCGVGLAAMLLSDSVAGVYGLDIAPKMLEYAEDFANRNNVYNVRWILCPWVDAPQQERIARKHIEVVIANHFSGMLTSEDVLRMAEISTDHCFNSSFVEREDQLKKEIFENILGKEFSTKCSGRMDLITGTLDENGYNYELHYIDNEWDTVFSFEEAYTLISDYFRDEIKVDQSIAGKIYNFLQEKVVDGKIVEHTKAKVALCYWNVHDKK